MAQKWSHPKVKNGPVPREIAYKSTKQKMRTPPKSPSKHAKTTHFNF